MRQSMIQRSFLLFVVKLAMTCTRDTLIIFLRTFILITVSLHNPILLCITDITHSIFILHTKHLGLLILLAIRNKDDLNSVH